MYRQNRATHIAFAAFDLQFRNVFAVMSKIISSVTMGATVRSRCSIYRRAVIEMQIISRYRSSRARAGI